MKSAVVAYLLWCLIFVGVAGIHRFYAGKWITGLVWLFTGGLLLIGQVIDLLLIPGMIRESNLREELAAHRRVRYG
jgi:TM2 domain-containing membrane protein YozV